MSTASAWPGRCTGRHHGATLARLGRGAWGRKWPTTGPDRLHGPSGGRLQAKISLSAGFDFLFFCFFNLNPRNLVELQKFIEICIKIRKNQNKFWRNPCEHL
jgi:hypothetical protein